MEELLDVGGDKSVPKLVKFKTEFQDFIEIQLESQGLKLNMTSNYRVSPENGEQRRQGFSFKQTRGLVTKTTESVVISWFGVQKQFGSFGDLSTCRLLAVAQ